MKDKRKVPSPRLPRAAGGRNEPVGGEERHTPERKRKLHFPIVGLGASAGGLEALEQFLKHVPTGSGMAYVIVQHLDPTHKGIMPELLQRVTAMPVVQVVDRMKVRPDCVYVIPPNKDMSILHGILHLFEPAEPRGLRLPIDFFLRSLAADREERSIGVILSGMGSDGTLGLRAIKEHAGLVLVQEPASARFDSMPRSAIAAGLADLVAPAEELPLKIISCLERVPFSDGHEPGLPESARYLQDKIAILLRAKTGHDFSCYKANTVHRRIERRMGIHQISSAAEYVRCLQQNSDELELLFRELLIGVTSFFRDPFTWAKLKTDVFPSCFASHPDGGVIRAWSAGCSTGEEAYSLAIVFREAIAQTQPEAAYTLQIFATDIDQDGIDRARRGLFPANITADVSEDRLRRFFVKEGNGYRVGKEVRDMVTFATQNVIMDPPFTRLHLVSCRNLLIYLVPEMQKKLISLFHYGLNPEGALLLGNAETIGSFTDLFAPLDGKARLYRRLEPAATETHVDYPPVHGSVRPTVLGALTMSKPEPTLQLLVEQLLLAQHSPPSVLVNDQGDILHINGRTGKYLEPASGRANWNVFAMARDGLRQELPSAFRAAVRQDESVLRRGVAIISGDGERNVDLTVQALPGPGPLRGLVLITFAAAVESTTAKAPGRSGSSRAAQPRVTELERELRMAGEDLRALREEMQTSQEEVKSINEELQSANEELQSTNEELTTSKEELQSMNEELQTVNAEQASRMDELSQANNDLKNLLASTDVATVFLDKELRVRWFTPGANRIFRLLPGDVGRPLTDINTELLYPGFPDAMRDVLRTLVAVREPVATGDGLWFEVRIMPYHTLDNRIDGVVITFADITSNRLLDATLRATGTMLRTLIHSASNVIIGLSARGEILEFNPQAEIRLGRNRNEVLHRSFYELFIEESSRQKVAEEMGRLLGGALPARFTCPVTTPDGVVVQVEWSADKLIDDHGQLIGAIAIGQM